jgi:GDP-4-dehydro-6-deoxy-D-mannose reductase
MRRYILGILITGASGFVGHHLAQYLLKSDPETDICGTTLPGLPYKPQTGIAFYEIDLKNASQVDALVKERRPDRVYHLAAQAFVPRSFEEPWETLENNILAQLNVIQACLRAGIKPRMLIVSSAEIYGPVNPEELPVSEDAGLRPTSPYSVSKIAQDMLGLQYYLSHDFPIFRARAFNHIGPGQNQRFVAPDFALQIARIEAGQIPSVIAVGDLTAQRDFTDVRDIVRAYQMIVESGNPGDVYNVCTARHESQ